MQPFSEGLTNVPAFLTKLWKMVSDSKTDHLICWGPSGNSFIILNQMRCWYELLPLYYKHNNMSSFVRQLNMYGFHKVPSLENGSSDAEKDEVQFSHPYFQKDHPELLKLIKRKVTVSKSTENSNQILKSEDLTKVLSDVKQLRGRQASVDSQLSAMKQENAILWRELAVLRQKHTKQQEIVNKLIHFLISVVHQSNGRMGVGVKRHYPLMLRASPSKKSKPSQKKSNKKSNGPIIHEVESEIEFDDQIQPDVLLNVNENDLDVPLVYSPLTPSSSVSSTHGNTVSDGGTTNELLNETDTTSAAKQNKQNENLVQDVTKEFWENPTFIYEQDEDCSPNELLDDTGLVTEDPLLDILENDINQGTLDKSKIPMFSLSGNSTNDNTNVKIRKNEKIAQAQSKNEKKETNDNVETKNMTIATRNTEGNDSIINTSCDLGMILDNNQSEIDLYKDILQGCGTLDANTLLGLFNDAASDYGFSFSHDNDSSQNDGDPMVSGQELSTYPLLPLEELLDDSLSNADITEDILNGELSQLNTPQIIHEEPEFKIEKSKI